jgi:hypothetical protein
VLALLDAERTTGAVVVPIKERFTTTEAATILGLSRPTLMKFVESAILLIRRRTRPPRSIRTTSGSASDRSLAR